MRILCSTCLFASLLVSLCGNLTWAEEPNNFFEESTILAPGVLSIDDFVTPGFIEGPDTVLGTLGLFGEIEQTDDDSSNLGNGFGSGLSDVPINPGGTIDFLVSGWPDFGFIGEHDDFGDYEVVVDVFDFFGDYVETLYESRTLEPGFVDPFSFSGDSSWLFGTYDVNINNAFGEPTGGDIDFYTFTGLTAGSTFSAEIFQETFSGFDSILGWFDDAGFILETNDDDGFETLSLIEGIVPASGMLTFAVTGFDDFDFFGEHDEDAEYSLELTIGESDADFDSDGDVDGQDFLRWQRGGSPSAFSSTDLAAWQTAYGPGMLGAVTDVPEPGTLVLFAVIACGLAGGRYSHDAYR